MGAKAKRKPKVNETKVTIPCSDTNTIAITVTPEEFVEDQDTSRDIFGCNEAEYESYWSSNAVKTSALRLTTSSDVSRLNSPTNANKRILNITDNPTDGVENDDPQSWCTVLTEGTIFFSKYSRSISAAFADFKPVSALSHFQHSSVIAYSGVRQNIEKVRLFSSLGPFSADLAYLKAIPPKERVVNDTLHPFTFTPVERFIADEAANAFIKRSVTSGLRQLLHPTANGTAPPSTSWPMNPIPTMANAFNDMASPLTPVEITQERELRAQLTQNTNMSDTKQKQQMAALSFDARSNALDVLPMLVMESDMSKCSCVLPYEALAKRMSFVPLIKPNDPSQLNSNPLLSRCASCQKWRAKPICAAQFRFDRLMISAARQRAVQLSQLEDAGATRKWESATPYNVFKFAVYSQICLPVLPHAVRHNCAFVVVTDQEEKNLLSDFITSHQLEKSVKWWSLQ